MRSVSGPSVKIVSIISSTASALRMSTPWLIDPAAMQVHQLGRGFVADAFAPAADMNLGAELEEARGHRFAEAGAAAGHQNAPSGEKLIVEHGFPP